MYEDTEVMENTICMCMNVCMYSMYYVITHTVYLNNKDTAGAGLYSTSYPPTYAYYDTYIDYIHSTYVLTCETEHTACIHPHSSLHNYQESSHQHIPDCTIFPFL
jgi:hypothetical protein